jgi:hypothetical protein
LQLPLLLFFDALAKTQHGSQAELKGGHGMRLRGSQ